MNRDYASSSLIVIVGLIISLLVLLKLFFGFNIDSDWFWFLAGIGLAIEGVLSFLRQKEFDLEYEIVKKKFR